VSGSRKYSDAVAIGATVFFAPWNQDNVGMLDTTTYTFSTIGISVSGSGKYSGMVAIGSTIYFAPFNQDNVGMLDTTTSSFSTIELQSFANNYSSAAVVGTTVYLVPYLQDNVGVLTLPPQADYTCGAASWVLSSTSSDCNDTCTTEGRQCSRRRPSPILAWTPSTTCCSVASALPMATIPYSPVLGPRQST